MSRRAKGRPLTWKEQIMRLSTSLVDQTKDDTFCPSQLSDCCQCVKPDEAHSDFFNCVPQGSVFGPAGFTIYIVLIKFQL